MSRQLRCDEPWCSEPRQLGAEQTARSAGVRSTWWRVHGCSSEMGRGAGACNVHDNDKTHCLWRVVHTCCRPRRTCCFGAPGVRLHLRRERVGNDPQACGSTVWCHLRQQAGGQPATGCIRGLEVVRQHLRVCAQSAAQQRGRQLSGCCWWYPRPLMRTLWADAGRSVIVGQRGVSISQQ